MCRRKTPPPATYAEACARVLELTAETAVSLFALALGGASLVGMIQNWAMVITAIGG